MELSGFPAAEVEFGQAGQLIGDGGAAVGRLAAGATDLLVLCHGWSHRLYAGLATSMRSVTDAVPGRRIALACVRWPCPEAPGTGLPERLDQLRDLLPGERLTINAAAGLVPALTARATARTAFAAALLSVATRGAEDREDASAQLFSLPGGTVMDRLAEPERLPGYLVHYELKARASAVGERGLAPLLDALARPDLRIHLAGHGFGGRLVTAAANARPHGSLATLTLLQAMVSQYGFSADWEDGQPGGFRGVLDQRVVAGPILVTHSVHDLAVEVPYVVAELLVSGSYGSMGRNGALRTTEAVTAELLPAGGRYRWRPSVPHNLLADRFVSGHADVRGPEIAHALLSAIAAS